MEAKPYWKEFEKPPLTTAGMLLTVEMLNLHSSVHSGESDRLIFSHLASISVHPKVERFTHMLVVEVAILSLYTQDANQCIRAWDRRLDKT